MRESSFFSSREFQQNRQARKRLKFVSHPKVKLRYLRHYLKVLKSKCCETLMNFDGNPFKHEYCYSNNAWQGKLGFFDQMAFSSQRILLIRHTHQFPQGTLMKIIKQQIKLKVCWKKWKEKCIVCAKFIFPAAPCLGCMQWQLFLRQNAY